MLFSSLEFLFAFLPLVLCVYFLLKKNYRNVFLLLASLFFYFWGAPRFSVVMVTVIAFDYLMARMIAWRQAAGKTGKVWLALMLVVNISVLFIYKYLNFFTYNLSLVFHGIPVTDIALPLGISFFLFQAMSYPIDVYRGDVAVQKNLPKLALYVTMFPQLVAGPIVRYGTVMEEIDHRSTSLDDFAEGAKRFILGLAKKVLLANSMATVADSAFALAGRPELSIVAAWLGILAYTMQIFFDFSGYSDMAIGLGRIFGFHFLENFDYPYISKSISEFWRRWHISMGTWFRDYVYFPLGGSRVAGKGRLVFNLFVVWALTGLWHGANWTFLIWGLMYFVLIAFEKLSGFPDRFKSAWAKWLYRAFTLLCVMAGWVVFRADNLAQAAQYARSLLGAAGQPWIDGRVSFFLRQNGLFLLVALLGSTPFFRLLSQKLFRRPVAGRLFAVLNVLFYVAVLLWSVSSLVVGGHNPFIYFNF